MTSRTIDHFPRMKVRGKHRKARRRVYDVHGRIVSQTWVRKPPSFGGVRLGRGVRLFIELCPGRDAGCLHCWRDDADDD